MHGDPSTSIGVSGGSRCEVAGSPSCLDIMPPGFFQEPSLCWEQSLFPVNKSLFHSKQGWPPGAGPWAGPDGTETVHGRPPGSAGTWGHRRWGWWRCSRRRRGGRREGSCGWGRAGLERNSPPAGRGRAATAEGKGPPPQPASWWPAGWDRKIRTARCQGRILASRSLCELAGQVTQECPGLANLWLHACAHFNSTLTQKTALHPSLLCSRLQKPPSSSPPPKPWNGRLPHIGSNIHSSTELQSLISISWRHGTAVIVSGQENWRSSRSKECRIVPGIRERLSWVYCGFATAAATTNKATVANATGFRRGTAGLESWLPHTSGLASDCPSPAAIASPQHTQPHASFRLPHSPCSLLLTLPPAFALSHLFASPCALLFTS